MRLYLDDERPCPDGWAPAKTAHEAIAILSTGKVTEVSLDHDLGPPEAGTGYDVVCWLEERAHTDPSFRVPAIRIHTANPAARIKMQLAAESIRRARS